jgi:nucleotide-binding universal stress UspA family protein
MYDIIVVGTDGSEKANKAVERGLQLAEKNTADLHVITVVNTARYGEPALSSSEIVLNELEERGTKQLKRVKEQASDRGVEVITECFHGEPGSAITKYAEENDADLIVLGSHGHTHPRSVMGSTAKRVLHDADREVLIV